MKLIAPSILSADFARLSEEITRVEKAGADWIHVDVMDGHYVPNITIGPLVTEAVRRSTKLPIDVHLMIEDPDKYVPAFVEAGANYISVHVETCAHLNRSIQFIKSCGAIPGVVLNPSTPISNVEWVIEEIEFVLVMSVNPGFGGQAFIKNSLDKIRDLRNMINRYGSNAKIQVDGGVNEKTIGDISQAGADIFVAGSAIFGSNDYAETIRGFRKIIDF